MRVSVTILIGALLGASACAPVEDTSEPVATRTHALLRVERASSASSQGAATGVAFAGVVRVPESTDPELLLRLSGKGPSLPSAGQCVVVTREREVVAAPQAGRAEFLDAGVVLLGTSNAQTLLAPRAFEASPAEPLSGVVYTSRDRAEPVPSGLTYLLKTTGSDQLPALELRVQAPDELGDVTIDGSQAADVTSLNTSHDVALAWRAGDARDLVYAEVSSNESGGLGLCAFRDADGHGTLPRGLFGASGQGALVLHRLREVAADVPSLDGAEVRFDFALTAPVTYR